MTPTPKQLPGYAVVPLVPTEEMWGGLARDIMMWLSFDRPTPRLLFQHLKWTEHEVPDWLRDEPEMQALDHVPSKGTRCVLIYRAMVEAAPQPYLPGQPLFDNHTRTEEGADDE